MSCLAILRCSEGCSEHTTSTKRSHSRPNQALCSVTDSALGGLALAGESAPPELLSLGSSGSLSKLWRLWTESIGCLGKHVIKIFPFISIELGKELNKRLGKDVVIDLGHHEISIIFSSNGMGRVYTWWSVDKECIILRGVGAWISSHYLLYVGGLSADYSHCEGEWVVEHLWL